MTPHLDQPVSISADALRQLNAFRQAGRLPEGYGLRVGIRGGGCGAAWLLGFDQPGDADEVYNVQDVVVIIDRRHLLYVLGAHIDYGLGQEGAGFTIDKTVPTAPPTA